MLKKKHYYKRYYVAPETIEIKAVSIPNDNYGTTTGSGRYLPNAVATLTATPKPGCKFMQWYDESTAAVRRITVEKEREYQALYYRVPEGVLRIVDSNLNLYTYAEWSDLIEENANAPLDPIGVGIWVDDEWLVMYKDHIGPGNAGEQIDTGCKLGSGKQSPITPGTVAGLLLPHSGKEQSDIYKNQFEGNQYAAWCASLLQDGGLDWYVPNLYEYTAIFSWVDDDTSEGSTIYGFDSHFELIDKDVIKKTSIYQHSYWSCDAGYGSSATVGSVIPFSVRIDPTSHNITYRSSGNYTWLYNYNYVRPVARFGADRITITYWDPAGRADQIPEPQDEYKGDGVILPSLTTSEPGYIFYGWSGDDGSTYRAGEWAHFSRDVVMTALWDVDQSNPPGGDIIGEDAQTGS